MNVKLKSIKLSDKSILSNLFQLYMHDITRFFAFDINKHGLYDYKYIDYYWINSQYRPFFIVADKKIAGFVLVNNHFMVLEDKPDNYNVSEFFILNIYRRQAVGREAARLVFDKFKGNWEVRPIPGSPEANKFWLDVISKYTNGVYQKNFPKPNRLAITFKS